MTLSLIRHHCEFVSISDDDTLSKTFKPFKTLKVVHYRMQKPQIGGLFTAAVS